MNILHISKIIAIIGLLLVGMPKANAQQVTVDAKIDSLQLLIGEQAKITLEVSMDANQKLQMPVVLDTLVRGVEVLDIAKPDTQMLNEGKRAGIYHHLVRLGFVLLATVRSVGKRPSLSFEGLGTEGVFHSGRYLEP